MTKFSPIPKYDVWRVLDDRLSGVQVELVFTVHVKWKDFGVPRQYLRWTWPGVKRWSRWYDHIRQLPGELRPQHGLLVHDPASAGQPCHSSGHNTLQSQTVGFCGLCCNLTALKFYSSYFHVPPSSPTSTLTTATVEVAWTTSPSFPLLTARLSFVAISSSYHQVSSSEKQT